MYLRRRFNFGGGSRFGRGPQIVELRVTLGRTASMPSPDAAARHTGAGVARRQAHHERMRDERAREAAAGNAELPPEDDAVEMASAVHVLDSVAEVGPNYTLLRSKETKAMRRKRQRHICEGQPRDSERSKRDRAVK